MDFLIINWNKIDTLPELLLLVTASAGIAIAVYYLFVRNKDSLTRENDKATIESYKERLEVVELETKDCHQQHAESLRLIHGLQGEIKAYKDLALIPKDFVKELQRNQKEIIKLLKGGSK